MFSQTESGASSHHAEATRKSVLQVIGQLGYGGAETLILQVSVGLVSEGHRVGILVLDSADPALLAQALAGGVQVWCCNASLWSPLNALRIWRAARAGSFDVVHAHLFPSLYWAALASMLFSKQRFWFYTEHSTSNGRRRIKTLKVLEGLAYRRYRMIACISPEARTSLLSWVPELPVCTIENGIDFERFSGARALDSGVLPLPAGKKLLLMVGAFRPEKNQRILVEAMLYLPDDHILVLAGDGGERQAVMAHASNLGISERVLFVGVVRDVERLFKRADVYVLPSLFEGFGISALEAAASGVPIVFADVPGLADMMEGAGWSTNPRDARDIARAISEAVCAGKESERVRKAKDVASRFSITTTVQKYKRLYDSH